MKKLLVLLALAFGFAYFYPIRHEQADNACAALDKRYPGWNAILDFRDLR